jgi:hypothetical protein
MDSAFARGRHAAVMTVLLVACSSSSSNGGDPGDGAGDGGRVTSNQDSGSEGGSSGGSAYDAAVDYDADIAACASSAAGAQRVACCETQIPRGYFTQQLAEQACLCGSNGPCTSACDQQYCASLQSSTPACESCVETNLAGSCRSAVAMACAADPGCVAYQACVGDGGS